MSYSLDANVLLYASDTASPFHQRAVEFLRSCARRRELLCLAWPTLLGYLRIATHPRIFEFPLSPKDARRNVAALIALPRVRLISEGNGFWELYCEVAGDEAVRGNLVPDAHLATLLKQAEVRTLYTTDSGFRRFEFLDVRRPFD